MLDTTKLTNGLHTIAWTATDSAGMTAGIGSRFFRVANNMPAAAGAMAALAASSAATVALGLASVPVETSPVTLGRRGWAKDAPWIAFATGRSGRAVIRGEEMDRFELALGEQPSMRYTGFVRTGDALNQLPAGSHLNAETGEFTWSPSVGFVGTYDLVFFRRINATVEARIDVRFILHPKGSGHTGTQVVIDGPRTEQAAGQPFMVAGWAADLNVAAGTGISTLHVWAYPTTGAAPIFLGTPTSGEPRPDVAAVHGEAFRSSGFRLLARGLAPGDYGIAGVPVEQRQRRIRAGHRRPDFGEVVTGVQPLGRPRAALRIPICRTRTKLVTRC